MFKLAADTDKSS